MMKPIKTTSAFDFSETDTQTFDSQFSPSSVYGEDFKGQDVDELLFLQNTVPFDDTVRVEDTFETQAVNLGGETQVLDGPDCVENMDTQLLLECNNEVIVDSDGEGTDRTEVLGDTDELSDDDSVKKVGNHPGDLANMLHASLCKQGDQGFKAESNALSNEQCSSGEKFKGEDVYELQFLQSAVPFVDTVPLEDAFETQMMDLGGETQALDGPPCVENMDTQLLVECDNEAVDDSDGEATIRTEVLGNQELSGNDSVERVCNDPVDPDNMLYTTLCKQNNWGFKAESDAYNEQHSSELNVPTATPLDKDTAEPKAGSVRKGFTSVRAASFRASGLAARRKFFEGTNNGSCSVRSEFQSVKEHITDDNGVPFGRESSQFGEQVNQEHVIGDYNEQEKGFRNEIKCRLGSSTARKLFAEDTPAEVKRPNDHINNATGGADLPQLLACDKELAGLSYVDSQEPGESSQANALDFVDRFLKFSVTEFDQEADLGKSTGDKSKHVSSAKGIQCLAKRVNYKSRVSGIFDWDDNREDEGGGDFFSKMKESFFDNGGQSRRSFTKTQKLRRPDSKGSGAVNESRDKEERLDTHEKIVGVVHSDSRLEFHNKKGNDTTAKLTGTKIRKNLIKEADEQLNIGSSDAMEATVTEKDMPDMLDGGFDTQMAAEAMEALCYGVDISDFDHSDANEDAKSVSNNSLKGGKKNRAHCKHNFFQKKESSNCIVVARQPKQTKRIDTKQSKESSVSSRKRSKNVKKQSDIELVNTKLKKAKCNTEDQFATNECWDNSPEVVKKGKEEKSLKINDIDESGKCHVTASSSGPMSVKKQGLQEQLGNLTPIACRTRQRKKAITRAGNASIDVREGINDLTEVAVLKGKRKRSSKDVDSFEVLNATEKFSRVGSNLAGELENSKLSEHKQPGPKFTGKTTALKIDELSYPKGRRTHRKLSGQLNRTGNQHGSSKQHVGREANAQSIARLKRSKTDAISTCMDLSIKRQTRSSTCAGSVLSSLDLQSEQRSLQQKLVRGGSGDAALNHNSVDINENTILKDKDGVQASQHIDRKSDADKTLSAENVGVNVRLDTSPREGCKPSGSDCTTPVNCRTPINEASPICMGDEYLKQSCRKNLARSSLMKEIDSLIGDGLVRTSAFKDSRKRRDMANVRALFSHHLDDDIIKQQKKILARLGASIASSMSDATHFITDKFVRTRNMLEAIAFGKPVVTHLWLESCGQASCLIDEKNYILRDAKKEKEFGFSLPVSLARACQSSLLQGQKVLITPNTKPGKEVLVSLVKAVHGLAAERIGRSALKNDRIPDDLLILSCEEDYAVCVPFLEKGAAVYSSELLLNGIVTQKLEYERHRLFVDHVKRTRSTIWLKKDSNQYIPVTKRK